MKGFTPFFIFRRNWPPRQTDTHFIFIVCVAQPKKIQPPPPSSLKLSTRDTVFQAGITALKKKNALPSICFFCACFSTIFISITPGVGRLVFTSDFYTVFICVRVKFSFFWGCLTPSGQTFFAKFRAKLCCFHF